MPTKLCLHCEAQIEYEKHEPKFCSKSCSAKHNNKIRVINTRKVRKDKNPFLTRNNFTAIRICSSCKKLEVMPNRVSKKTECSSCCTKLEYRHRCAFKFDLRTYPERFNLEELKTIGMFHPTRNPTGLSRDHKFSCNDGYLQGVDPLIVSHPANCLLITQASNSSKHSKSSITLEQLLNEIKNWK